MESASSEESFQSTAEDWAESVSPLQAENDLEGEFSQYLSNRIEALLPTLDEDKKRWILDNFKYFKSPVQILQSNECKFLTRRQSKSLEPILEDVIQKWRMSRRMHILSTEVNCDQSTARWIFENFHDSTEIDEFLEKPELDDLTRNQIESLGKVLKTVDFTKTGELSEEKDEVTLLRDCIHENVKLDEDVCQWVATFWIQVGNIDELLNNKELDKITMKQKKDLKQLLMHEVTEKPSTDLEDDLREILNFAEASFFGVSESSARRLLEIRGKKYIVPEVAQALVNDVTLDFPSKFELLRFLLCSRDETLEKILLQKSEEYKNLEVEFETLAYHCCLKEDLITKIKSNLFDFKAVDDLDQYEDMTVKQNRTIKENLDSHLKQFQELKLSISNHRRESNGDFVFSSRKASLICSVNESEKSFHCPVNDNHFDKQNAALSLPPQCSKILDGVQNESDTLKKRSKS